MRGATASTSYAQQVSYFALEGELTLDGRRVPEGTWLEVPPGVEHAVEGVYLSVITG